MSILVIHPVEHFLSHCCRVLCDGIHIHSTECQPQAQGDSMSNSGRFTTMEGKRKDHQRSEGTFFFGHLLVVSKEKIGSLSHTQIIVKVYHCFRSIPSLSNNSSGTKTKNKTLLDWYKNGNAFGGNPGVILQLLDGYEPRDPPRRRSGSSAGVKPCDTSKAHWQLHHFSLKIDWI